MRNPRSLFAIVAAAGCVAVAGCTTLEVADYYAVVGEDGTTTQDPRFHQAYGVRIAPNVRLYSIGMLGAPVVPTRVRPGDPESFELAAWINSTTLRDFSFASAPCLQGDDGRRLCPHEAEVFNFNIPSNPPDETDAERRLREMQRRIPVRRLAIALGPGAAETPRIDRARVYRHFRLDETASWERFSVDVVYRYRCGERCPVRLTLERTGLIDIDGRSAMDGPITFERRRERDYRPAADVQ